MRYSRVWSLLVRRSIIAAAVFTAVLPAFSQTPFTCGPYDPDGICISLGVKPGYTYITSVKDFAVSPDKMTLTATVDPGGHANGKSPIVAMFDEDNPTSPIPLTGYWVVRLQKMTDAGAVTHPLMVCNTDNLGTTVVKSTTPITGPDSPPPSLWGAEYKLSDGSSDISAQLDYDVNQASPCTLSASPQALSCLGSECRIVFSTVAHPSGLSPKAPSQKSLSPEVIQNGGSHMPMLGGSVEFRLGSDKLGARSVCIGGHQMVVKVPVGASQITIPENGYRSPNLQGKNWTLFIDLDGKPGVTIKGKRHGREILFEAPGNVSILAPSAEGSGVSYETGAQLTVALKIGWSARKPLPFDDQSMRVWVNFPP